MLSAGLLNILGVGIHARYGDYLGFGIDYQWFKLSLSSASMGLSLVTLDGRLYPFGGAFFLSGGFAYQHAGFDATTGNQKVAASVGIPLFKLGLGFMGRSGFVMGIDLALELPLGSTHAKFSTPAPDPATAMQAEIDNYNKAHKNIADASDKGLRMLPFLFQLNLLRIGYLF